MEHGDSLFAFYPRHAGTRGPVWRKRRKNAHRVRAKHLGLWIPRATGRSSAQCRPNQGENEVEAGRSALKRKNPARNLNGG
jgi:hypothetical protein